MLVITAEQLGFIEEAMQTHTNAVSPVDRIVNDAPYTILHFKDGSRINIENESNTASDVERSIYSALLAKILGCDCLNTLSDMINAEMGTPLSDYDNLTDADRAVLIAAEEQSRMAPEIEPEYYEEPYYSPEYNYQD